MAISSPPYPADGVTVRGLYAAIKALNEWALQEAAASSPQNSSVLGSAALPIATGIQTLSAYEMQPVAVQFYHFRSIRGIREQWDKLLRRYEDCWDAQVCVSSRNALAQLALSLVAGAFQPYEQREARQRRDVEQVQTFFARLVEDYRASLGPMVPDGEKAEKARSG